MNVIPLLTLESQIKRRLRSHLRQLGFVKGPDGLLKPPGDDKEVVRQLHRGQRVERLNAESVFIKNNLAKLLCYFASGTDVVPEAVSPRLQLVQPDTVESDLFRLACLTWTIPVSQGYGRRMRFLVWDDNNGKVMGLIALSDPVFNMRVRDDLIGWGQQQRREHLVGVMDAFVLGALPPYNMLLGGKLVACLIRTQEIRRLFLERYGDTRGIISGKKKRATLAMVTTSSALGRSSVYNRLALDGIKYFQPIGYTVGYGHFHIPADLFEEMRRYLKRRRHKYSNNHRFGNGPNWKFRAVRATLGLLGMNAELLRHGISREVFMCKLASNAEELLRGDVTRSYCRNLLSVKQVASLALERWIIPRSKSRPEFSEWKAENIASLLAPPNMVDEASLATIKRSCKRPAS